MSLAAIKQITIIGLGLMGSSLARSLKEKQLVHRIVGCSHSRETLDKAKALGIIDAAVLSPKDAVKRSDLIILCTPLSTYSSITAEIIQTMKPTAILTDVGSVKEPVVAAFLPHLKRGMKCVPAHPIAGSEKSGIEAGFASLYEGRKVIITPIPGYSPESAIRTVSSLWETCGAHTELLKPEKHDQIYADMSHTIQLLSFGFMHLLGKEEEQTRALLAKQKDAFFTSFIRLGASDPVMWRDIFTANRTHILASLASFTQRFRQYLALLEEETYEEIMEMLESVSDTRQSLKGSDLQVPARSYSTENPFFALGICLPKLIGAAAMQSFTEYHFAGTGFLSFTEGLIDISALSAKRLKEHHFWITKAGNAFLECIHTLESQLQDEHFLWEAFGKEANSIYQLLH